MTLEQFVLLTKFLLLNNCQGLSYLDPIQLAQPIDGTPLCLPTFKRHIERLYECRTLIQPLFVAFFHLRDNLVNYPLLQRTVRSTDLLEALKALERLSPDKIAKGFQVSVSGDKLPFQHIVKLVRDYAGALRRIQQRGRLKPNPAVDELEQVCRLCNPPDNLNVDRLSWRVNELRNLSSELKLCWQRRWDLETDALDSQPSKLDFSRFFERLTTALNEIRLLQTDSNVFTYLATQRQVKLIADCPEYGILQGLNELVKGIDKAIQGHSASPERSPKFREFDQVFQSCRGRLRK
jgi:hypothetical protein